MTAETERDAPRRPKLVQRLESARETHRDRHLVVRGLFIVAGFTLLLGGITMLVTPGPAFVVIPIGLAVLSLEFAWAEALLERSLEEAARAQRKAAETTTAQRVLSAVAAACFIAAICAWGVWGDIPLAPV